MSLPTEADIAREIGEDVDPDAVYAARKAMRGALGRAHAEGLAALHAELANSSPFSPDAAAAGRRALRNVALSLFVDGDVIEGLELAHRQLADADNMTERFGALAAIALKPDSARERALDAFGRRYAMEPLILDKWYSLQAHIPESETLDRVRALMNHRGFSLANPNRVRALIGGFSANQTQFNRLDGGGFALLEEVVVFLDPTNPQIAARTPDRDAVVALARAGPPRSCGGDAEAHRRPALALAGCSRHRDPKPRVRAVGERDPECHSLRWSRVRPQFDQENP